jgi:Skp family chaperone for outer membrane proteins
MKRILLLLIVFSLIATSALASSGKIAYVDTQKVFEKTSLGKKYQDTIREYFGSRKNW